MQISYKQGDIIFVPYPYTDLTQTKKRPVIIISKNQINKENYIVAKITSVIRNDEFSFVLHEKDLDTKLNKPSEVRTNEIFTIHKTLVIKKFARLTKSVLKELTTKIQDNISTE